jgi:hypothetical protein
MLSSSVVLPSKTPHEQSTVVRPAPSVREVHNKDGAVLLDISQGICFGMSSIGVKIWQLLQKQQSLADICDALCAEYPDASRECIDNDIAHFVQELEIKGVLIMPGRAPKSIPRPKILSVVQKLGSQSRRHKQRRAQFLFWKALLGLLAFDLLGLGKNFFCVYEMVRGWNVLDRPAPAGIENEVSDAVNLACAWYPKHVLCLQRSAVITCLLRHCGVSNQMVVGAQKLPFKAHAWVEVAGKVINDESEVLATYMVWERL